MCRGREYCTAFGDPATWSRTSPLPPPSWIFEDVQRLAHAVRIRLDEGLVAAQGVLTSLREAQAREWFVEHAQISANHRRRILRIPRPGEVTPVRVNIPESRKRQIWSRDNYRCRYCGLPTIPPNAIKAIQRLFGTQLIPWGASNASKHGTLLVARSEYDHVTPLSLGGDDSEGNLVTSCPGCNYGKDRWSLQELGLVDPREQPVVPDEWNGLTSILGLATS
jgi:5-methylcytosine-specific restriction endonuclease McrA